MHSDPYFEPWESIGQLRKSSAAGQSSVYLEDFIARGFLSASASPSGEAFHNMILGLLLLISLAPALDIRLLPSQIAFHPDGSSTEGRGIVTVSLGAEYTGQTAPVKDYSISFWYQSFTGGFSGAFYSIKCDDL
jgi:hypothetical protein